MKKKENTENKQNNENIILYVIANIILGIIFIVILYETIYRLILKFYHIKNLQVPIKLINIDKFIQIVAQIIFIILSLLFMILYQSLDHSQINDLVFIGILLCIIETCYLILKWIILIILFYYELYIDNV